MASRIPAEELCDVILARQRRRLRNLFRGGVLLLAAARLFSTELCAAEQFPAAVPAPWQLTAQPTVQPAAQNLVQPAAFQQPVEGLPANVVPYCCPTEPKPRTTLLLWNSDIEADGGPPPLDEPLASDRPDFTEASCTVGRGVVQLEMGYTYTHDADGTSSHSEHSIPEMLWRIGMLAEWFEFRIAYNHSNNTSRTTGLPVLNTSDSGSLYLGAKLGLTPQQGIFPEMALVPQMTVPTSDDDFTADRVLPGVNWLYGWDINEYFSLAGSTQGNIALDDAETYYETAQSVTIGYTLTEKLGGYTEWYGIFPSGAVTVLPEYYFNGGFIYRFSNNFQYDIRAGVGLNDNSADYFIGSGFVTRW